MPPVVEKNAKIGYLGLGSNVGDRKENLRRALSELEQTAGIVVLARSSLYETEPVGEVVDQREFLNAVARIESELNPLELLAECKRIEARLGRVAGARHGPRLIDIDILLLGSEAGEYLGEEVDGATRKLVLPHPALLKRRFVLVPLLELDRELTHPGGTTLAEALVGLGAGQRVRNAGSF